jgi:endonuclease/exonuclease/phosphatase family metal-dependent hydrolase
MGWLGPTHFLNVYLKSGGNYRRTQHEQLMAIKGIVKKALVKDSRAHFVILGDFNEDPEKVLKHLENVMNPNILVSIALVGSNVSHFPVRGMLRALDSFVTKEVCNLVHPF